MPPARLIETTGISESLIRLYLDSLDISEATKRTYRDPLVSLSSFLAIEGLSLAEVGPGTVEDFRSWLLENYTRYTAKEYLGGCRRFFNWLFEAERPADNPFHRARPIPIALRAPLKARLLTENEADAVVEAARGTGKTPADLRNCAMVSLMLYGMLTPRQVREADVEDVLWLEGRAVARVREVCDEGKDTVFELDPRAARPVHAYEEALGMAGCGGPLIVSLSNRSLGKRLSERSVRDVVSKCLSDAGVTGAVPYSLKVTGAARTMSEGHALDEVRNSVRLRGVAPLLRHKCAMDAGDEYAWRL